MSRHKNLGEIIMDRFGDQEEKVLPKWDHPLRSALLELLPRQIMPSKIAAGLAAIALGVGLTCVLEQMDDAQGQNMIVKREIPVDAIQEVTLLASR